MFVDAQVMSFFITTNWQLYSITGKCTNFGLKEEVERKWKKLEEIERRGDYTTLYSIAYR